MNGTEYVILVFLAFLLSLLVTAFLLWRCKPKKKDVVISDFYDLELLSERSEDMVNVLRFKVGLPKTTSGDTIHEKVVVTEERKSGETVVLEVPVVVNQDFLEFDVHQDSEVSLLAHFEDDSGNVSFSDPFMFTALDTIPPKVVGVFHGLLLLDEVVDDPYSGSVSGGSVTL